MKFLVMTSRKEGISTGLPPKDLYEAFKKNVDYFINLQKKGKIVAMGGIAGQHGSYKIFTVEDREELKELINNAPLSAITDDQIHQIVEFDAVLEQLRSRLGLMTPKV